METPTWINDIAVLQPAQEFAVQIECVETEEGLFTAQAVAGDEMIKIGWIFGCNDQPNNGQVWLVRVLGFDYPSGAWLAQALLRES